MAVSHKKGAFPQSGNILRRVWHAGEKFGLCAQGTFVQARELYAIVAKRWRIAVAAFVVVLATTGWVSVRTPPVYEAEARVVLTAGAALSPQQFTLYLELLDSPVVLEPLRAEVGVAPGTPVTVRGTAAADTGILALTATAPPGALAADLANAAGPTLAAAGREFAPLAASAGQRVQVTTIRAATPPAAPSSPDLPRNLALGTLAGVAVGLGLALLRHALDTRIRTEADVRALTDRPVLASLRRLRGRIAEPHGAAAEAYRRLRTNLQFVDLTTGSRHSFVVTSPLPNEGKTITAVNLALTMARSGAHVLLVDADLHRPSVADVLGVDGDVGLTALLLDRARLDDVVQPWKESTLYVLPAGQLPPNPSDLVGSAEMAELFREFGEIFDFVIVDAPPILPVIDPVLLHRLVGGMLVVACAHRTRKRDLARALQLLGTAGIEPAGLALNMTGADDGSYGAYGAARAATQSAAAPAAATAAPAPPPPDAPPAHSGRRARR